MEQLNKKRIVKEKGRLEDVFKKGSNPLEPFDGPIFAFKINEWIEYLGPKGTEIIIDEDNTDNEKEAKIISDHLKDYKLVTLKGSNPSVVATYCTTKKGVLI